MIGPEDENEIKFRERFLTKIDPMLVRKKHSIHQKELKDTSVFRKALHNMDKLFEKSVQSSIP